MRQWTDRQDSPALALLASFSFPTPSTPSFTIFTASLKSCQTLEELVRSSEPQWAVAAPGICTPKRKTAWKKEKRQRRRLSKKRPLHRWDEVWPRERCVTSISSGTLSQLVDFAWRSTPRVNERKTASKETLKKLSSPCPPNVQTLHCVVYMKHFKEHLPAIQVSCVNVWAFQGRIALLSLLLFPDLHFLRFTLTTKHCDCT